MPRGQAKRAVVLDGWLMRAKKEMKTETLYHCFNRDRFAQCTGVFAVNRDTKAIRVVKPHIPIVRQERKRREKEKKCRQVIESQEMPPKKKDPGVTAILIDAGPNMSEIDDENGKSAFENAINTADWIVSRKLFSEDPTRFAIMAYNVDGSTDLDGETYEGVMVHDEEFQTANFEHLKFITKELKQNSTGNTPNFFKGVLAAVSLLKSADSGKNPESITLIVLTNGKNENLRQEKYDLLVDAIRETNVNPMVIGIPNNPKYPASRIVELVEELEGTAYSFQNVAEQLSNYQARQKNERKNAKLWDIAPGIRLPVTFSIKAEKASALLKFKNADIDGNEMVRFDRLHVENQSEDGKINEDSVAANGAHPTSDTFSTQNATNLTANNGKMMLGYNFGKSLIMMDPEYLKEKYNDHNFNEGQTGGVLKLIQFTKRANILDSYLLDASAKTVLPAVGSDSLTSATVSLIEAMLSLRVAAICRYTFHAKSHVQLVALLAHRDEQTGVAYLRSVKLPYSDDMRTLKFPKFSFDEQEEDDGKPTLAQLSAVDDLIDSMQLKEGEISSLVEGGLSDPRLQMQCHFLKSVVLNPNDTLEKHADRTNRIIDDIMAPKTRVISENAELFEKLGREFNLQPIRKTKRERVQVAAEDIQNMIDEWTEKRQKTSDDEKGQKRKKKLTRREELILEWADGESAAAAICQAMLKMIADTCGFQQNRAVSGFFELLLTELKTIRSVFVEKSRCDEFNELLKKLKEEEDFEPFAEFIAEEKACNPISSSEVPSSEVTDSEAAEFWDEN
ncbi:unnamed protein product [Caenorhabditis sp. 36 PRJEB53466]|nr:unnamed protein product [Caenorhabditis sp. 36 PRJEB53466]